MTSITTHRQIFVALALVLMTAHRLRAPILEEPESTPAPKQKREMPSRPKPKPEATAKPTATPNRSFAGTWTGSAGDGNSRAVYVIKISDDEKTVWINWNESAESMTGAGLQLPCNRFHEALTWTLTQETSSETDTLRIDGNGTASFVRDGNIVAGATFLDPGGPFKFTGTLSRQDSSSAPPVLQTATTPITNAVAKNAGGLPTAKPVPNKSGFVYNPFDSNTKVLLDVRGKTAGTKVKDPFSGKLFIVP